MFFIKPHYCVSFKSNGYRSYFKLFETLHGDKKNKMLFTVHRSCYNFKLCYERIRKLKEKILLYITTINVQ